MKPVEEPFGVTHACLLDVLHVRCWFESPSVLILLPGHAELRICV